MKRTFHPVGQGAFYTEEFDGFTVVYDCGSSSDKENLIHKIEQTFTKGQGIDAVFISHLHTDHVNGLEHLLKYCSVKKLFIPLLGEEDKVMLLIDNEIQGGDPFITNLIENSENREILGETRLVFVPAIGDNFPDLTQEAQSIESLNDGSGLQYNPKLTSDCFKKSGLEWVFIPFNFRQTERSKAFNKKLAQAGIVLNSVQAFKQLWTTRKDHDEIIAAYNAVPGDFNTNSMTLFSGTEQSKKHYLTANWFTGQSDCNGGNYCRFGEERFRDIENHREFMPCYNHNHQEWQRCSVSVNYTCCDSMNDYRYHHNCNCQHYFSNAVGCLYFGDYNAHGVKKWAEIVQRYKTYWNQIGVVQIPHHGSTHNYNCEINQGTKKLSIISCGASNQYGHPHQSTLKQIILDGGSPVIVTEYSSPLIMEIR